MKQSLGQKVLKICSSMGVAIALISLVALFSVAGSLIPQGRELAWYSATYGERTAAFFLAFHLDDIFHSPLYLILVGLLLVNLILCSVTRIPALFRRLKKNALIGREDEVFLVGESAKAPEAVFRELRLPAPKESTNANGKTVLSAEKNKIGHFGSWITHLGILLLVLGFALGQITKEEYTVYGLSGETKAVGETGLTVSIDKFTVDFREDDSVSQYLSELSVYRTDAPEKKESGTASVNHPVDLFGYRFSQNSTGFGARVSVFKDGKLLEDGGLCVGETLYLRENPDIAVLFYALYPDYVMTEEGPKSASGRFRNPAYQYVLYYKGEAIGMNLLGQDEYIRVDDYEIVFTEPQFYTLLQVKRDSFIPLAFAGAVLILIGLILSFYVRPEQVWAVTEEDGTKRYYTDLKKAAPGFEEKMRRALTGAGEEGGK